MKAKQLKQRIEDAILDGITPGPEQTVYEAVGELLREYTEAVLKEYDQMGLGDESFADLDFYSDSRDNFITELFAPEPEI